MIEQTQFIRLEIEARPDGQVARLSIVNDRKLNTPGSDLMSQFVAATIELERMSDLRAVVLAAEGTRAFIGGADIREMVGLDPIAARRFISRIHACCDALRNLPVPVIAEIGGFTFGAGLEIAAACDLRVAADTASFGMPEVRLGIPSVVEAALLPMLIGWGRTRRLLLLGETITAAEAERWGLVEAVVAPAALRATVDAWVDMLLHAGPRAITAQKRLMRSWEDLPIRAAISAGIDAFAASWEHDEPQVAMQAFLDRQAARKGRPS